jgi:hypothetical protein
MVEENLNFTTYGLFGISPYLDPPHTLSFNEQMYWEIKATCYEIVLLGKIVEDYIGCMWVF